MKTTIADVAKLAETSPSTVSKVLTQGSESDLISESCRKRVHKACRELNYVPKKAAQSLRTGRSYTIGGLMGMDLDPEAPEALESIFFHSPVIAGILSEAQKRGFGFTALSGKKTDSEDNALNLLESGELDALIVPGSYSGDRNRLAHASLEGQPVVFAGWPVPDDAGVVVQPDDTSVLTQAVDYLLQLGHCSIGWIGPVDGNVSYASRRRLYLEETCIKRKIRFKWYTPAQDLSKSLSIDERIQSLREPLKKLLKQVPDLPTGFFVYEELWALALYQACSDCGIRIPDDISIITFDDIYSVTALPSLTVVSLEQFSVGRTAMSVAADLAEGKRAVDAGRLIFEYVPSRLVIRQSTGPV